jgi:RsiW-degrading membrane proteinase PrsW (M82 family)
LIDEERRIQMSLVLLILVSVIPAVLWVWFFYSQDVHEPEPPRLIFKTFIFGILATIPTGILEGPFRIYLQDSRNLLTLFLASIFGVGLIEELMKHFAFQLATYGSGEIDEPVDSIIYSVTAGLGFAAFENVLYTVAFGLKVGLVRAFVTLLAHASFSGIVGYYTGIALEDDVKRRMYTFQGLGIAVFLHGLYDFLIIGKLLSPLFGVVFILATYRYLSVRIRQSVRM